MFSIPYSVWTSRSAAGQWARRHGLFQIPEELNPPEVLRRLKYELSRASDRAWANARDGLAWVLEDPRTRAVHLALVPAAKNSTDPIERPRLEGLQLGVRHRGVYSLTAREKRDLLLDADSIRALTSELVSANGK